MRIRESPSQSSPCGRSTLVNPRSSSCAPRGARTSADPSTCRSYANAPSGSFERQASRRLAATTKSASTACGDTRCGGSSRRAMKKPRWPASRDKRTSKTYSSIRCETVSGHAALLARQPEVRKPAAQRSRGRSQHNRLLHVSWRASRGSTGNAAYRSLPLHAGRQPVVRTSSSQARASMRVARGCGLSPRSRASMSAVLNTTGM